MKNTRLTHLAASLFCFALVGDTGLRAADAPAPEAKPTTGEAVYGGKLVAVDKSPATIAAEKERDDAKAQVAQLQQQNQQQQIVAEYYKAVAEKNDAVLRVVALQQELTATKNEVATLKAERDALTAKAADFSKPPVTETKK